MGLRTVIVLWLLVAMPVLCQQADTTTARDIPIDDHAASYALGDVDFAHTASTLPGTCATWAALDAPIDGACLCTPRTDSRTRFALGEGHPAPLLDTSLAIMPLWQSVRLSGAIPHSLLDAPTAPPPRGLV